MHQNHYFYSVFSKKKEILSPPQKNKEHYLWTQSRYFFFRCPFFLHFCFFGFLLCPVFWGVFFLRGMKKQKKDKIQNKTTKKQKRKKDHKMQTKRPLSVVTKKTTTQKQNNTNEFFTLERNNTRKTNKNKRINHKNQTTLLTNRTQKKHQNCKENSLFSRDWKQNKKEE